jgi:Raf kinase inhibitor-like YbhB/YbcL family protein
MLEHLPPAVGRALKDKRPGLEKTVYFQENFADAPELIQLTSEAFTEGQPIPARYTADGEKLSPPLAWEGAPTDAAALVLIIEDPDAPAPSPLVHTLAWALPPERSALAAGALRSPGSGGEPVSLGRNSFLGAEYLPPDPPPGHGPHRYVFQLYALDQTPELHGTPRREQVVKAMTGHVLAKGVLIGTYERPG